MKKLLLIINKGYKMPSKEVLDELGKTLKYYKIDVIEENLRPEVTSRGYIAVNWLRNNLTRPGYDHVHLQISKYHWNKWGLKDSLFGRSEYLSRDVGYTYGRWDETSVNRSEHYDGLKELVIGIWHEMSHSLVFMQNKDVRLTHYHFYGLPKISSDPSRERWIRKPDPAVLWESLHEEGGDDSFELAPFSSRDPQYLEPQLRNVWIKASTEWNALNNTKVFLTQTMRGEVDQIKAFNSGNSKALFGQSLHNYLPAYAFDVAFTRDGRSLDWSVKNFKDFSFIAKRYGLEAGTDWVNKKGEPDPDHPHFQLPMTYKDAQAGRVPKLKKTSLSNKKALELLANMERELLKLKKQL